VERRVLLALVVCFAVTGVASAGSDAGHMEPKNVSASCGTNSATIGWSAVGNSNLVGYNVFEKATGATIYTQANAQLVTMTSYLVTGLVSATTYDFGVTAVYNDGVSSAMAGPVTCTTN
jgi:hypothetical protein